MKDITIIIPIHEYSDDIKKMLDTALKSVPNGYNVLISTTERVFSQIDKGELTYDVKIDAITSEESDFCTLVNKGVEAVDTKWFSILEFDDKYSELWFDEVEKYVNFYPGISIFMPFEDLYDVETNKFVGYGNEAVWASSFSEELGYVDNDCLQNFFDFYMTGSVFNTEDWKTYGGLKKSMTLTFWYEFLLRMTYNGKKVMVIPRVGYVHNLNREGSLLRKYSETISESDSKKYVDLAKQEYFFTKDRNKTIENNEEGD